MSTQNIMWTALPNGLTQDGTRLRLSVLVSPRLTADAATGTLAEFPDFQDWPAQVAGLTFSVEFTGGPTASATPVVEPGNPALDSPAWKALFPTTFPVRSYAFDDRSALLVRSFPTKKVLSFLTDLYQTVAVQWPPQMLTPDQYGVGDEDGIVALGDIYPEEGLERYIRDELSENHAIPASFGSPQTDFFQVRDMHQFLSTVAVDDNGHRQNLPPQTLPDVDFHNAVGSLGSYPMLERALGLVIDLEVPLAGVPGSGSVRVQPSLEGPPALTPFTAYILDTTEGMFLPAAGSASEVTDGMLLLSGTDQYDVVELDVDGGAEKAMDFSYNLTRLINPDAPTSIDTPDTYGLPSLRSAGFSVARVDRATRLVNTFNTASANNTALTTGGSPAPALTVNSDSQITVTSPPGTGTVDITVTTPAGTSAPTPADQFSYTLAPTVTGVNPDSGSPAGGDTITLTGTGFTGATGVDFGGSPAPAPTVNSDSQITVTSPPGTGAVNITVTTSAGTSAPTLADQFSYTLALTVTGVNPNSGSPAGGDTITLTGTGFTGATGVDFGGSPAPAPTVNSDSQITVTSPPGTGAVNITVTTPAGTSAPTPADQFSYTLAPTVTGVNPNSGSPAGGDTITLTGTGFTGATGVDFDGSPAPAPTVNSDSQITVTSPPGTGAVNITVTTPEGTSATTPFDQFSYAYTGPSAPTVTGVEPNSGSPAGGDTITITGAGFTGATGVSFGATGVTLYSDDVTRGYRVDVWDSMTRQWHSLHLRDGTYQLLNGPLTRTLSDEGFATVATTQSADGTSTDLRLPESLFRWAGWSLSVARAGNTIGPYTPTNPYAPQPPSNQATTAMQLQTSFLVHKGTLPRLRFGAQYQFRVRAVDLAGNSFTPDATLDAVYSLPPQPIPYLRYEPVAAPAVVLRQALDPVTTPGESGDRIVIRSNFNTHIEAVSERHIAAPKTSETMAETHGMLDTAAGPPDQTLYTMLVNHDGSFAVDPAHPDQPVPFPGPQLTIPYLPDPFAPGAAFATLPGAPANSVFQVPFTGAWPDTTPFRFVLDEGSGAPEFSENPSERVLRVQLPKAEKVTVAMSCYLTDDPTTTPPNMLSTMQIWSLIEAANPAQLADLRTVALEGGHWMLTPPRLLTLVHAVQQPLIEPQFQHLEATKGTGQTVATLIEGLGQTFAVLTDEFPIDGKSTIQVDIQATWQDPVDDLSTNPQPVILNGAVRAFSVPVEATDTLCVIDNLQQATRHFSSQHEFHDTKHRNVTYTAVATTRFKEYFPDALTANPDNITRTSQPVTVSVLNSARPAAPSPLYVVPAFGWETDTEGAWQISKRRGGALRVYLDRPWFSSGEGELLAAILLGSAPAPGPVPTVPEFEQSPLIPGYEISDSLNGYVTQWGQDPIWSAAAPPTQAMPLPQHFLNAVAIGTELTLDELTNVSNEQYIPFTAVGHQVSYDDAHGRRLWYCDIQMDMGEAYFPFVRLALARYQPQSLPNAHLSRVVLADFMQLAPDRAASITFDPIDPTSVQLAVNGLTYTGPGTATMTATLEMQAPGSADSAWLPVADIPLMAHTFGGPDTLWTGPVVLPAPRGSRPFRLVIREFETYTTDSLGSEQQRLVYADILNLQGNVITATPPALGSALDGFWGTDDSVHVNFIGTDNNIHELYIAPGHNWVDNNLTALAGAVPPTANTPLAGYWGTDDSVHVNFIGTDNNIHELYIAPGHNWVDNDLTTLAGAVAPAPNTALVGYWGTDNSVHVNFIGTDNNIHELYIAPGHNWVDNDLTTLAGAVAPAANTTLDGYWGTDNSVHVNFIGTDNNIHELYIAPGHNWVDNDLTGLAGAVAPAANTTLDGYWGTDNSQHVNFIGTDNNIHELYIAPGINWVDNDLTGLAGAVPPTANTALDGYWGTDDSQHVNFIGTDNNIHELYIAPGINWVDNNLTALAGAVPPTANTALAGYWGTDASQHVNFIGTDNNIHELYIAPGTNWVDNNLTALA